ncbi:MAG: heavy metal-responsive transcriptional regulator [Acidobacteriota bacterium]|nr:heavy metal-responsive transcriptional regulator [Acidobacteriota bacterium]
MSKAASAPDGLLAGVLARLTGVGTDTLRHYERKGVLPKPRRLGNGYRTYTADSIGRVRLVRRALSVGFTLDELGRFMKARDRGQAPCREVRALAAVKLEELETWLTEMEAVRDDLRATIKDWDARLAGKETNQRARLLEALVERETGRAGGCGCAEFSALPDHRTSDRRRARSRPRL